MGKYYRDDFWMRELMTDRIILVRGGQREEFETIGADDIVASIPLNHVKSLANYLLEEGYIRPLIKNEGRQDDVKLMNRLIDVLDKHAGK
jgi:hypothetical protein